MHSLIISKNEATMSSREIADLLEARHDNVKLSIERLTISGTISFTSSQETSHEGSGARPVLVYMVNKRDSYIVVAQMSPKFTAKLVDRWQELEAKQKFDIPTTLSGALRLAAAQAELLEVQTQIIEQQKPAVQFVERYVESSGNKGFREVCKLLKAKENQFREFLLDQKIMYRLGGNLTPYSDHLDAGRFETNAGISAGEHAYTQAKFTPKGINWVAGLWAVHNLESAMAESA